MGGYLPFNEYVSRFKMVKNHQPVPIGSMYAIYGNIYHQYTPMLAYIPYMDPMGYGVWPLSDHVRNDFAASKQVLPCISFGEKLAAAEVSGAWRPFFEMQLIQLGARNYHSYPSSVSLTTLK